MPRLFEDIKVRFREPRRWTGLCGILAQPHLPYPSAGIFIFTVVKTAWALFLAHMAGTDDFVFVELPEAEAVVGACVNYVPVRVTLQAACTVSNLLHAFHEQQTRSMAFETIEHDDLLAQCTS